MRAIRAGFFFFATVIAAYGQLDSDTLTITASRSLTVVPDKVQVIVNVTTPGDLTLDDVLAAIRGTGISAANLSGVGSSRVITTFGPVGSLPQIRADTEWGFLLTTPLSNLKEVLVPLTRFNSLSDLRLNFYVRMMPVTSIPCPWQPLLEDARAQAIRLADSAGLKAGPIVSLSDTNQPGVPFPGSTIPTAAYRLGDFSAVLTGLLFSSPPPILPARACSLTVQFKLLR